MKDLKRHLVYLHLSLFILFLGGCVSVNVGPGKSVKANNVQFKAPLKPFEIIDSENADRAWQSKKTGNTLAFISECQSASETNLKKLDNESLNALSEIKITKNKLDIYNGRESSFHLAEGTVDGVAVKMALVVFQKNNCNFTISLVGKKSSFDSEYSYFELFIESFKVP